MSLGGAAGAMLQGDEPPSFGENLLKGVLDIHTQFGVDGFDLDIENRAGMRLRTCTVALV
jgi:hypothetical protein